MTSPATAIADRLPGADALVEETDERAAARVVAEARRILPQGAHDAAYSGQITADR